MGIRKYNNERRLNYGKIATMWIKQLTLDNREEFIKWSKKAFPGIDAVALPIAHIYRTLGAFYAFDYSLELSGERYERAAYTWLTLWAQENYTNDFSDIIEDKRFNWILERVLLSDISNTAPDSLYEKFFDGRDVKDCPVSILYNFMQRSEANAARMVEQYDWLERDPVLNVLLNKHESPEEKMSRYWKALLSSASPSVVAINEFLEYAKQYQDIACQVCSVEHIDTYLASMRGSNTSIQNQKEELLDDGLRRILTVVFKQRPEIEKHYYNGLKKHQLYHVDLTVYPSDDARHYLQMCTESGQVCNIHYSVWSKIAERWKHEVHTFSSIVNIQLLDVKAKTLLMEIEKHKKYGIDMPSLPITMYFDFDPNAVNHSVSPIIIGLVLNYATMSSVFSFKPWVHKSLLEIDQARFLAECQRVLGKKRVAMIQQKWDMHYFLLKGETFTENVAECAIDLILSSYYAPNCWNFHDGVWPDGLSDMEFLRDYYHMIDVKKEFLTELVEVALLF